MIQDLLLRFPNKPTAEELALMLGYARQDPDTGVITPILATHEFALSAIGEHFTATGNTIETPLGPVPEMLGDGKYWVIFRTLVPTNIRPEVYPHIVWHSGMVDDLGDPVPRPAGAEYPQHRWS